MLTAWQNSFVRLKRLIIPSAETLVRIGHACQVLRSAGKLDPTYPKHYNDISIAALACQIGATVITKNKKDFVLIKKVIDFEVEGVSIKRG